MRDKAHYNLPNSMDLRLYPDHTKLLEENEAFLSIDGRSGFAEEIIAMRVRHYEKRKYLPLYSILLLIFHLLPVPLFFSR
jgi:hypothetical protein